MTAPYIELIHTVRSYDGHTRAVDDINLSVAKGEFVTFLGPSGSGKTTTLMMLAGFEEPDAGIIRLAGRDITHVPSWKRNIGVVFQNYALFPHMSVSKNVAFPLEMRKVDRDSIARKTAAALNLVGLSDFGDRYPSQLSGGQQQRVALARGLVFEPDVLLLDEPLGALDKNLRELMQIELKRIHREVGITMIYVTHDQSEAMTMSDRVVVFRGGKIEQSGGPIELYDRPKSRFVAEFIGDSNILAVDSFDETEGWANSPALGRIGVRHFNPAPDGGSRFFLIRPEGISAESAGGKPHENRATLNVSNVIQYGNESVVFGTVPGTDLVLKVKFPSRAGRNLPVNGEIQIGWSADDGYVI